MKQFFSIYDYTLNYWATNSIYGIELNSVPGTSWLINVRVNQMWIKNGQSRDTGNIGYTRHWAKTNKSKNTKQKTKKMSNKDLIKNRGWTQVLANGKISCLLRYSPCYSYSQDMVDTTVHKQTQITSIRHQISYKQLGVKMNRT